MTIILKINALLWQKGRSLKKGRNTFFVYWYNLLNRKLCTCDRLPKNYTLIVIWKCLALEEFFRLCGGKCSYCQTVGEENALLNKVSLAFGCHSKHKIDSAKVEWFTPVIWDQSHNKTFSLVFNFGVIWYLFSLLVLCCRYVHIQGNITSAYLYAPLREKVYITTSRIRNPCKRAYGTVSWTGHCTVYIRVEDSFLNIWSSNKNWI